MLGHLKKWRAAREIIDWNNTGRSLFDDPKYKKRPLSPNTMARIATGVQKFAGPLAPYYLSLLGYDSEDGDSATPKDFVMGKQSKPSYRCVDDPMQTITTQDTPHLVQISVKPFIMGKQGHSPAYRGVDEPAPTVTCESAPTLIQATVKPFLLGQQSCSAPRDTERPMMTATTDGKIALIRPAIIKYYGTGTARAVDDPLDTITTKQRFGLAQPFLTPFYGVDNKRKPRAHDINDPVKTISTNNRFGLAEPVIIEVNHSNGNGSPESVEVPLHSQTTKQSQALVSPVAFIVPHFGEREGQQARVHDIDKPAPAVTASGAGSIVQPFILEVNHEGGDREYSINDPLRTVTNKNGTAVVKPAAGLVEITAEPVDGESIMEVDPRRLIWIGDELCLLDLRFRMLENPELAGAMGFSDKDTKYEFCGNKSEITKQIGNAVPVHTARALVSAILKLWR